jgi:hypothetical protein
MKEILETTQYVTQQSSHVSIDTEAVNSFVEQLMASDVEVPPWDCHYHYCGNDEETVSYLLVLDTLNFCFWAPMGEKPWETVYHSEKVSGYFGLAAALKSGLESGVPITKAEFLCDMTEVTLRKLLGGTGRLPLFDERVDALNELGQVLLADYGGKAVNFVEEASGSAVRLARLLTQALSSFRDQAVFQGRPVYFYKRAQIFASDLFGAFDGSWWGGFKDTNNLTAFADYKLPQVLRHLGIFVYSHDLAEKIDAQILIEAGSLEEVEIRANTIWAVEWIRQGLARRGKTMTAPQVDWMLWNMGQDNHYRANPYHRTLTIFY